MAKVVVISDDMQARDECAQALRLEGFDVLESTSQEALLQLDTAELALVDVALRGGTGFELTRKIKKEKPSLHVVLTGDAPFCTSQLTQIECGAVGLVARPCDFHELADFLWEHMNSQTCALPS